MPSPHRSSVSRFPHRLGHNVAKERGGIMEMSFANGNGGDII